MIKYQAIANDIKKKITDGKYMPGDQLSLEKEMCEEYSVSRITIKRAVDELVNLGLIVKRRGSGTFVKSIEDEKKKFQEDERRREQERIERLNKSKNTISFSPTP